MGAAEIDIIKTILLVSGVSILLIKLFTYLQTIAEETTKIREDLDYIVDLIDKTDASKTLDEIEEELKNSNELTNTRR